MIAIISATILLSTSLIPLNSGYAVSYSASTTSAANTIESQYFTIGTYQRNTFNPHSPVTEEAFSSDSYTQIGSAMTGSLEILLKKSGNTYSISNEQYILTYDNCYLAVRNS